MPRPSRSEALQAVKTLIAYIGDDPDREGVLETPERVLSAWSSDWGSGYAPPPENLVKLFEGANQKTRSPHPNYNQMIVVCDIAMFSHCEHHLTPFFGSAHIAYIPSDSGIIGISKFARIVDHFARRLQTQERLTREIAEFLVENLSYHCAVTIEAKHMCMISRGVKQPHASTVTTVLRGDFYGDATTRAEFTAATKTKANFR